MSFLKKLFGGKDEAINSYDDFWNWFQKNEKEFFSVVKNNKNIEKNFFDKISPKLGELKEGYFFLTGMCNENTAELVLTADGNPKNVVFIEELVNAAPKISGWKFTAFKEAMNNDDFSINMGNYEFSAKNINFYANEYPEYPDEIDVCIVHNDLNEENKNEVGNGTYIFLDNYLGEIDFLNNIDNLEIIGKANTNKELIPITKLKPYLTWRQKEFIEKYDGIRYDTENDEYSILEAELKIGNPLIAVVNTNLLNWDSKASHPWICILKLSYDGSNNNGMPNENDYELLNTIEEELMNELKDVDGYLNIGRQTAESEREIFFACKDFRKPSKIFYTIQKKHSDRFNIEYDIYKDKYWQSFEKFRNN